MSIVCCDFEVFSRSVELRVSSACGACASELRIANIEQNGAGRNSERPIAAGRGDRGGEEKRLIHTETGDCAPHRRGCRVEKRWPDAPILPK